jgi:hypothetical protein
MHGNNSVAGSWEKKSWFTQFPLLFPLIAHPHWGSASITQTESPLPKDHSCQVYFNLVQQCFRRWLKCEKVNNDEQCKTDRQTQSDTKS